MIRIHLPVREMQGQEDPLEKETATWDSCLGQRSLASYSPWGQEESGMTEQINQTTTFPKFFDTLCSPLSLGLPLLFPTVLLHLDKSYLFLRSKLESTLCRGPFRISRLALVSLLCALCNTPCFHCHCYYALLTLLSLSTTDCKFSKRSGHVCIESY